MSRWPPAVGLALTLALAWTGLAGCSRKLSVPRSAGAAGSGQLPFDHVLDSDGVSPTEALGSETVPSEISIRLRSELSSASSQVGNSFDAILDAPVVVAGRTVAPRGAAVTGVVLDVRASVGKDPGYMRITVTSILVNGKSVPLQASSIFAKGGLSARKMDAASNEPAAPDDVRFSTGHRFTFRLLQPLHP